jgi:hypothetical protein
MPHSAIEQYIGKLSKQQAIKRLMLGEAAKLPHMLDEARQEWAQDIDEKISGGVRPKKVAPLAVLKMMGIGVRK